jgi:hypothetical protein
MGTEHHRIRTSAARLKVRSPTAQACGDRSDRGSRDPVLRRTGKDRLASIEVGNDGEVPLDLAHRRNTTPFSAITEGDRPQEFGAKKTTRRPCRWSNFVDARTDG